MLACLFCLPGLHLFVCMWFIYLFSANSSYFPSFLSILFRLVWLLYFSCFRFFFYLSLIVFFSFQFWSSSFLRLIFPFLFLVFLFFSFLLSFVFSCCLTVCLPVLISFNRPDMTFAANWGLKTNHLSNLSVSRYVCCLMFIPDRFLCACSLLAFCFLNCP